MACHRFIAFNGKLLLSFWLFCSFAIGAFGQSTEYVSSTGTLYSEATLDSVYRLTTFNYLTQQKIPRLQIEKKYNDFLPILKAAAGNHFEIDLSKELSKSKIKLSKLSEAKKSELALKHLPHLQQLIKDQLSEEDVYKQILYFQPDDRITHFHSEIFVRKDGILEVKEVITIQNPDGEELDYFEGVPGIYYYGNNDIVHGLRREIPTSYATASGFVANAPIELQKILLDGVEAPYFTEDATNGIVIYIGDKYEDLAFGEHVFEINYKAKEQVVFMNDHDEIYINVTGNGWTLEMDEVSCDVRVEGTKPTGTICYTGPYGSKSTQCSKEISDAGIAHFAANEGLLKGHGITIAVSWPKGIIAAPSIFHQTYTFARDNWGISLLVLVFVFLALYNYRAWKKVGRDAKKGVIYPQFDPPGGMTPAGIGFVAEQSFSTKLAAAELTHLAIRGVIRLKQSPSSFEITQLVEQWPTDIPNQLADRLEHLSGEQIIHGEYCSQLEKYCEALEHHVKAEYQEDNGYRRNEDRAFFRKNSGYLVLGTMLIILGIGFGGYFCLSHPSGNIILTGVVISLALIVMQIIFARIISAYNERGRKIMDHIEGFRMYLVAAEEIVLNRMTTPAKTPELFEKFLPYAMALDCENEWADQFEDLFKSALNEPAKSGVYSSSFGYRYFSSRSSFNLSSSLTRTISSANVLPSKGGSSGGGFSGGGFSGGGSMGGGGGGW